MSVRSSLLPQHDADEIDALIRKVPDFPVPGVLFRDVTPLLATEEFGFITEAMAAPWQGMTVVLAGLDSRGFIFGAAMAAWLDVGFVAVRKAGKLPPPTDREDYALEYGTASFELPLGIIQRGQRVVVVDDVLATGGSARAAARLLRRQGAEIVGFSFLVEIADLNGAKAIRDEFVDAPVHALLTY